MERLGYLGLLLGLFIFAAGPVIGEDEDLTSSPDVEPKAAAEEPVKKAAPGTSAPKASKGGPKRTEKGNYIIEKRSDGSTIKYQKKTKYEFEGADIEGLFKRPSGTYISNVQGVQTRSIIRIRKNFDAEVEDSARLLR